MKHQYIDYRARLSISKSGKAYMRLYDRPIRRSISKEKTIKTGKKATSNSNYKGNYSSKRSCSRTRKSITELVDNNLSDFKSLITLTFREEIDDYDYACKCLKDYIARIKYRLKKDNTELKYLAVIEVQERRKTYTGKGVFHFHILTNLEIGSFFLPKRAPKKIYSTAKKRNDYFDCYDLRFWGHGYSSARRVSEESKSHQIALYLSKYFTKSIPIEFYGKRKYFCSKNLDRNIVKYLNEDEISSVYEVLAPFIKSVYISDFKKSYIHQFIECEYNIAVFSLDMFSDTIGYIDVMT